MRKVAIIDKIPQSEKSMSKKDIVINELIKSKKPMSAEVVSKITKLPIQSVRAYLSVYSKMGIITESTCNCCQISKVYRV